MSLRSRQLARASRLFGPSTAGILAPGANSLLVTPAVTSSVAALRFNADGGWGGTPTTGEQGADDSGDAAATDNGGWGGDESNAEGVVGDDGGWGGTSEGDANSGWGASTEPPPEGDGGDEDGDVKNEESKSSESTDEEINEDSEATFSAIPELDLSNLPEAPPAVPAPVVMDDDAKREKSIKEIYQPEDKTNEQILALNTINQSTRRTVPSTLNLVRNRFYHTIGVDNLVPMQEAIATMLGLGQMSLMYNDPAKIQGRERVEGVFRTHPDVFTIAGDYISMQPSGALSKTALRVAKSNSGTESRGGGGAVGAEVIKKFSVFDVKKHLCTVPDRGGPWKDFPYFEERRFNFDFHSEYTDLLYYDLHRKMVFPRDRHLKNIVRKAVERAIYKAGVPLLRKNNGSPPGRGIGARNIKLVVYRHLKSIEKENAWKNASSGGGWDDIEEADEDSAVNAAAGDDMTEEAKRTSRLEEAAKLDPYLEKYGYKDFDALLREVQDLHFMHRGDIIKMDWQQQVTWAATFIPAHGCSESHFRKLLMTSHALPNHSRFEERLPGTSLKEWLERHWSRYLEVEETGPNAGKSGANAPLWIRSKLVPGSFPLPNTIEEPLTGYTGFEEDCRLTCMALDVDEGRVFPEKEEKGTTLRVGDGYGLEDIITLLPRNSALEYNSNSWYHLVKATPTLSERVRLSDTQPNTRASVYIDASSGFSREMFEEACDSNGLSSLLKNKHSSRFAPLHVFRTKEDAPFGEKDEVVSAIIEPNLVIPEKVTKLLEGTKYSTNVHHELIYVFCRVAHVDTYMSKLKELVPKVLGDDHTAGGRVVEINIVSAQDKETVPVGKHHPLPPKGTIKGKKPETEPATAEAGEEAEGEAKSAEEAAL